MFVALNLNTPPYYNVKFQLDGFINDWRNFRN